MAARRISLDQVRIAEPCPVSWDTMQGDDRARFCNHCNLHVHNLSAMREDEAQRLICDSAGRLCVAYFPNESGGATALEYRKQKQPRYRWKLVALLGALSGVASACATAVFRAKPPAAVMPPMGQMMTVGIIAPPVPKAPPTTCPVVGDINVAS